MFPKLPTALLILLLSGVGWAQEPDTVPEKIRRAMQAAKNPNDLPKEFSKWWSQLRAHELETLTQEANDSLALHAYARLHNGWIHRHPIDASYDHPDFVMLDADRERFLGFLEGRLKVSLPWWWQRSYGEFSQGRKLKYETVELKFCKSMCDVAEPLTLELPLGGTVLKDSDRECRLPFEVWHEVEEKLSSMFAVNALLLEDVTVLAFYNSVGNCWIHVRPKQGPPWWAQTWYWQLKFYSGVWEQDVGLRIVGNRLFVFGSGTLGPSVEGFDLRSGQSEFRYSRELWNIGPPSYQGYRDPAP